MNNECSMKRGFENLHGKLTMKIAILLIAIIWVSAISGVTAATRPLNPIRLSKMDRRLRHSIEQTQYLHFYGDGPLWRKTTGLSGITPLQGIEVRDKRLIHALLRNFRCENLIVDPDDLSDSDNSGYIHVDFMGGNHPFLDYIDYINHNAVPYALVSRGDSVVIPLRPGYGRKFEAFVRSLAERVHLHRSGVTVWDINAS